MIGPRNYHARLSFLWVALLLLLSLNGVAAHKDTPEEFVWLEAEAYAHCNVQPNLSSPGHKEFLSDEKWLDISIDAGKVEKETPVEGVLLQYPFTIQKAGDYEVWNRIGYEFARSPFAWRIDGGDWNPISPNQVTTDLMALEKGSAVAWLKMGGKTLAAGAHTLEINLPRTKDEKGQTARILYASDAFCLHLGPFYPNSRYRPGEERNDPADAEAAKKVFDLPIPYWPGERASVPLRGLWQVCRGDEQAPGETVAPIKDLPEHPYWTGIPVPGDKNTLRPDLLFAHRLWFRTQVRVPDALAGRSFHLVFPQNNLNTTVYVNGVYCGFNKNPYARFEIDATPGVKTGVNEIWVGIRDAWYGYSANPNDPMKLRKKFDVPQETAQESLQDLAYPIWGAFQSGMLVAPEFVAAGPVHATDVFCRPSVARKELAVEVTLRNSTANAVSGEVVCQALDPATSATRMALPAQPFTLAPRAEQTLTISGPWKNPNLWWPDEPNWYMLRATVRVDNKPIDFVDTPFGFREWTIDGKNFKLNGVVFHGWGDRVPGDTPHAWLESYRSTHQQMTRFQGTRWLGLPPESALETFDRNGVVVRRQGMLDGAASGYNVLETDPDLKKLYGSDIKKDLMNNWRDQVVAQVQGERNHPSILIWSIENAWLSVDGLQHGGKFMDQLEAEVQKTADAVRKADPTRPVMVDGGGALMKNTLPVHGSRNLFDGADYRRYPALAYQANPAGGGHGRWVWDQKRPRFVGEDFPAGSLDPSVCAFFGPKTLKGKALSRYATGILARMLTEGYRWAGYVAWYLDLDESEATADYHKISYQPRAVFCRQWDGTFDSGQKVSRTLGIFNDTRSSDPITFTWTLLVNGKKIAGQTSVHHVAPGGNEKFDVTLPMPSVTARQAGQWVLTLAVLGEPVFKDIKAISILNPARKR